MLSAKSSVLGVAILAAVTVSCGSKSPNDHTITTGIQANLYADALTKPANISVAVKNGVVTLTGDVPSSDVALEAMKIANGAPGVRSVSDQMTINGAAASSQLPNAANSAPAAPPAAVATTSTSPNPPTQYPPTGASSSAPAAAPPSGPPATASTPPPPPRPAMLTLRAGERIQVRTIDAISSATADPGQVYRATLNAPLVHNGRVVIPAGAPVSLAVVAARSAGRIEGQSQLEVRATRIEYHARSYPIDTSVYAEQGKARGKQTAVRTGIGAAAGAVIGAIAGGGKGAAIGSAVGGGAGFGSDALTHGQEVKIPSEAILFFRLEAPLRLPL